jgi:hypothetical protein
VIDPPVSWPKPGMFGPTKPAGGLTGVVLYQRLPLLIVPPTVINGLVSVPKSWGVIMSSDLRGYMPLFPAAQTTTTSLAQARERVV